MIETKKGLIIGYGSIGERHAGLLKKLGFRVYVVSKRNIDFYESFPGINQAMAVHHYDYAVICTKTADHGKAVDELIANKFSGILLIEKPVFEKNGYEFKPCFKTYIAYNLRFHPIIQKIYDLVKDCSFYSMHVYCGQYLPSWRKNRDYRATYSASKNEGGGVLRDLSHELDYVNWMTGGWKAVAAKGGHFSDLEIDSDDVFCLILETKKCPAVTLQINYLDREPKREIILNGKDISIRADLIKGHLIYNNILKKYDMGKDFSYLNLHQSILNRQAGYACTYDEGIKMIELIEATEEASCRKIWIKR